MKRQYRTVVVVGFALVMATVASFAVYSAIQRIPVRQVEVAGTPVVVAAETVPVGTLIEAKHLRTVAWPARDQVEGAVADPSSLVGRGAIVTIGKNEPVTMTKVAEAGSGSGLPPMIPSGMRAISIRVNEIIGVAGFVVPGTRVDVVVTLAKNENQKDTMTRTVVSNVQVLTAGSRFDQEKAKADGKPIATSVVTLMVLPEDGERIALAQNEGKLNLALRNPTDVLPTDTRGIKLAALMTAPGGEPVVDVVQHRVVARKVAPAPATPPPPPVYRVETIRAAKRGEEVVQ